MQGKQSGNELTYLDHQRAIHLANQTCPYCSTPLEASLSNREHVIGRRFVPRGSLQSSWNLILRACLTCNNEKSDLEDDISAITMQPASDGQMARKDGALEVEAMRKAGKSVSRRTGKPVEQSREEIRLQGPLIAGGSLHIDAVAPPQVDTARASKLARMQVGALFYWITYDQSTRRGGFWPGGFYTVLAGYRDDWGNTLFRGFMTTVASWEPRVLATAADAYFRVAIRRHPSAACWSWALEWNSNMRLVGFFGEEPVARALFEDLPKLVVKNFPTSATSGFRIREEVSISPEDDLMFSLLESTTGSTEPAGPT